jgi:hypothetical protein
MTTAVKDKIAVRAGLWEQMKALMDSAAGREMTGEEIQTYDRLEKDLDARDAEIERERKFTERKRQMETVQTDPIVNGGGEDRSTIGDQAEAYLDAFTTFVTRGMSDLDADQR